MSKNGRLVQLDIDSATDSIAIYTKLPNEEWVMHSRCKLVRRENAPAGEDECFIYFGLLFELEELLTEKGFTLV